MKFDEESIIKPSPTDELLKLKEQKWKITLPDSYKDFIKKMNGIIPMDAVISYNDRKEKISRFFCILEQVENSDGWLDISVISSPIIERLIYDEDRIGVDVLPIAKLDYGNYLALNYHEIKNEPYVCVWDYEDSGDFEPITYFVAENFEAFINSLQ